MVANIKKILGFSLIEAIITISLIILLTSSLFPLFIQYHKNNKKIAHKLIHTLELEYVKEELKKKFNESKKIVIANNNTLRLTLKNNKNMEISLVNGRIKLKSTYTYYLNDIIKFDHLFFQIKNNNLIETKLSYKNKIVVIKTHIQHALY